MTNQKKPRNRYVYVGHSEKFAGLTVRNGEVFIRLPTGEEVKAEHTFSSTQYLKDSGKPKTLSRIEGISELGFEDHLASNLRAAFAIDTNSKKIGSDTVSVASVIECQANYIAPGRVQIKKRNLTYIVFKNCGFTHPEKFAWLKLIQMLNRYEVAKQPNRIGILTDHDLGRHSSYNDGSLPFVGSTYLPDHMELLYASDAANEDLSNTLIRECDKNSSALLRALRADGFVKQDGITLSVGDIPDLKNHRAD